MTGTQATASRNTSGALVRTPALSQRAAENCASKPCRCASDSGGSAASVFVTLSRPEAKSERAVSSGGGGPPRGGAGSLLAERFLIDLAIAAHLIVSGNCKRYAKGRPCQSQSRSPLGTESPERRGRERTAAGTDDRLDFVRRFGC